MSVLSNVMELVQQRADTGKQQINAADVSRVLRCFWDVVFSDQITDEEYDQVQADALRLWKKRQARMLWEDDCEVTLIKMGKPKT